MPVLAGVLQRKCACGQHTLANECDHCRNFRTSLQRHPHAPAGRSLAPPIVHEVLHSPGQPLDSASRDFFEPRFRSDFSAVRLHTDPKSADSAAAVNALAYTVGNHIVFGARRYSPFAESGQRLLAHELTHTLQQRPDYAGPLAVVDSHQHEREAERSAAGIFPSAATSLRDSAASAAVFRQKAEPDSPPPVERSFELDPGMFLRPMDAPAEKEKEKCEEFPGGSTDCEVDEKTGTPTGKVTHRVDEKNTCTRPCVEEHEAIHVKQLKTFCPELRDCYLAADKGKRPVTDCVKMAMFGAKRECEAYQVSVPCVEKRVKSAPECQTKDNKPYGARKLASEKCFRDKYCAGAK